MMDKNSNYRELKLTLASLWHLASTFAPDDVRLVCPVRHVQKSLPSDSGLVRVSLGIE